MVLAFAAVTCAFVPVAYLAMFSGFHAYDDEGFFLITLRDYLSGHALFTQVFTAYGPFYYEAIGGPLKLLGIEPNHEVGRFVTLAIWLLASLVAGLASYRLTRNVWLGLGAQFVAFRVLVALVSEPIQPGGLVSLLVMCLVAAATFKAARPRAMAALIGGIVGALCLVKINVGVFAAIAVTFAFAGSLTGTSRRYLLTLMAILVAVTPAVLMAAHLGQESVLEFAFMAGLAGAAIGIACVAAGPRPMPAPSGGWIAAGGAVTVVACVGVALAGGTRLSDLFNLQVLLALRVPQLFALPVSIGAEDVLWAAVAAVTTLAILVRLRRGGTLGAAAGVVRVAAGLFTWLALLLLPTALFLLALPAAWLATQAVRDEGDEPTDAYPRLLLPTLAVLESLQAYPAAGTQLAVGVLAMVPVGAIILGDGIRQLRLAGRETHPGMVRRAAWVAPVALLVNIALVLIFGVRATTGFMAGAPLSLPGAETLRVPSQQGADLRALVAEIDRRCSSFITFPGMGSFYVWTAQEPPVSMYAGGWMFVFDTGQQQAFVQQLQDQQRLCVVKNQAVIDFWSQGRQVPSRPLVEYIDSGFVDGGTYGDYQLLIRR